MAKITSMKETIISDENSDVRKSECKSVNKTPSVREFSEDTAKYAETYREAVECSSKPVPITKPDTNTITKTLSGIDLNNSRTVEINVGE